MSTVLCFGELLLRLSPELNGMWLQQESMPVFIGGAELNVATALAKWNIPVAYCTALPQHYLTHEIVESINKKNIDTSQIQYSGNRIGTYYLPQGTDLKSAGVIYDRAYSSFWELESGQIDWDLVLKDVSWFHFSAISPALNANVAAVCLEGATAASVKGITVSIDLNFRSKLWQYGKLPHEVMPDLVACCDVVMGNIWAVEQMLHISVPKNLSGEKNELIDQSQKTSESIIKTFSKCKQVAHTFRLEEGENLNYYATLYKNNEIYVSSEHYTSSVVDKVGSGDTFMAGLIWGNYHQYSSQEIINFAAAAAFNKFFIKGDATTASVEEIKNTLLHYE